MENYKKKPDEIEFMTKYSQATSTEEKARLKEEYEAELDAYLNWADIEKTIEEFKKTVTEEFDPAEIVKDKETALTVCHALVCFCLESGGMAEGSIMHKLGLGLMDYINRE